MCFPELNVCGFYGGKEAKQQIGEPETMTLNPKSHQALQRLSRSFDAGMDKG